MSIDTKGPKEGSGAHECDIEMFGRPRATLEREIAAAGGGKAYARAMLIALDAYLQICERSPRGPDERYVRLALNGVKYSISEHLVAAPPSLVHPGGPLESLAAVADHLYFPDGGDGLRLPMRACMGRHGVDTVLAALTLLSDAQARIDRVGGNHYIRKVVGVASQMLDGTIELHGRPVPTGVVEEGEVRLLLAEDTMRQAKALAAVGEEAAAREACTMVVHLIRQARSVLGCGMSDSVAVSDALSAVRDGARACGAAGTAEVLQVISSMASEYAKAGRGDDVWLEPQIADGSGERFLPVMFVGETCWQLRGVADASGQVTPLGGVGYEQAWRHIAFLRSEPEGCFRPVEKLQHLKWVQVTGPGLSATAEHDYFSIAEIQEREQRVLRSTRLVAMG